MSKHTTGNKKKKKNYHKQTKAQAQTQGKEEAYHTNTNKKTISPTIFEHKLNILLVHSIMGATRLSVAIFKTRVFSRSNFNMNCFVHLKGSKHWMAALLLILQGWNFQQIGSMFYNFMNAKPFVASVVSVKV